MVVCSYSSKLLIYKKQSNSENYDPFQTVDNAGAVGEKGCDITADGSTIVYTDTSKSYVYEFN